jgi:hypothetical protein
MMPFHTCNVVQEEHVPILAGEFEHACNSQLCGWLWDEIHDPNYNGAVPLTIHEMRYIANLLRAAQGLFPGVVQGRSEDKD